MKNALLISTLLGISGLIQGQNLFHINEEWNTENNIVGSLEFVDSAMDSNKGIVTVGSELIVNEGINAFVQYVNSQGQLLWEISYDYQGGDDYATGIYIDSQDDIYICGVAYDVTDDNYDGLLMKVNSQGQTVFSTVFDYGTNLNNYFTDIYVRQGKSYVCGTVENNALDYDMLTVGFDTSGQVEWDAVFGSTSDFDIGSTINGYSGGIIVSGGSGQSFDNWQFASVKYTFAGVEFASNYVSNGATQLTTPKSLITEADGSILLVGEIIGQNNDSDIRLIKLNADLTTDWTSESGKH